MSAAGSSKPMLQASGLGASDLLPRGRAVAASGAPDLRWRVSSGARQWRRSLSLLVSCRLCRRHASHRAAREVKARAGEAGVEDNGWQRVIEGGAALVGWAVSCIDTPSTRIGVGHGVRYRHVTSAACRCNRDCSILECSKAAVVIYN